MSITSDEWNVIEEKMAASICSILFQYQNHELNVCRVVIKETRLALAVYVDGKINWDWQRSDNENTPAFVSTIWRNRTHCFLDQKEYQNWRKAFGKRKADQWKKRQTVNYFDPFWNTAKTLCRQFKKLDGLTVTQINGEAAAETFKAAGISAGCGQIGGGQCPDCGPGIVGSGVIQ